MKSKVYSYQKMNDTSIAIVKKYEECAIKYINSSKKGIKIYGSYTEGGPHIANFSSNDYVINLMGINPNIGNKTDYGEEIKKMKDRFIPNFDKLDLYYVPKYNAEFLKKGYVCNNNNFVLRQYRFLCENNIFEKKYLKMSWQKYDKSFIDEIYKSYSDEYWEIINKLNNRYIDEKINMEFEDKYLIFTNLVYISNPSQNEMMNIIEENKDEFAKLIRKLFKEQLDYYKARITIIANSLASRYVEDNILIDNEEWEPVFLKGDKKYEKNPHIYKLKNKPNGEEKYVFLTARFFDRMDIYSKRSFVKDLKKLINNDFDE